MNTGLEVREGREHRGRTRTLVWRTGKDENSGQEEDKKNENTDLKDDNIGLYGK